MSVPRSSLRFRLTVPLIRTGVACNVERAVGVNDLVHRFSDKHIRIRNHFVFVLAVRLKVFFSDFNQCGFGAFNIDNFVEINVMKVWWQLVDIKLSNFAFTT